MVPVEHLIGWIPPFRLCTVGALGVLIMVSKWLTVEHNVPSNSFVHLCLSLSLFGLAIQCSSNTRLSKVDLTKLIFLSTLERSIPTSSRQCVAVVAGLYYGVKRVCRWRQGQAPDQRFVATSVKITLFDSMLPLLLHHLFLAQREERLLGLC